VEPPSDRVVIGFLPGDVNASGTASAADILDLIDGLNGILDPPLNEWQCDTDRSGLCSAPDILRVIDLLNGVATSRPWNNVSLPPMPE